MSQSITLRIPENIYSLLRKPVPRVGTIESFERARAVAAALFKKSWPHHRGRLETRPKYTSPWLFFRTRSIAFQIGYMLEMMEIRVKRRAVCEARLSSGHTIARPNRRYAGKTTEIGVFFARQKKLDKRTSRTVPQDRKANLGPIFG